MSDANDKPVWSSPMDDPNILPTPEQELPDGIELTIVEPDAPVDDDENTGSVLQDALEDQAAYSDRVEHDEDDLPGFERELSSLLNRYSAESVSGTPDYILASFLTEVLKSYNETVSRRAKWRGEFTDFNPSRDTYYTDHFSGERIKSPGDLQREAIARGEDLPRI